MMRGKGGYISGQVGVIPHRGQGRPGHVWSKDYEELPATSEAFIYLAMSRLMVKRLAHA
jgi:hypothetical protein